MASSTSSSRAWEALTPSLSEWILDAISSMGFSRMTPVQVSTIPLFMGHKDVVVEAVTGSGKTLAFLIPVIEKLLRLDEPIKKHHVGAIIISPTRELATQIYDVLLSLIAFHGPSAACLKPPDATNPEDDILEDGKLSSPPAPYHSSTLKITPQLLLGGTNTPAQDLSHFLKHSPNVLISTPGRLLELLSSPYVHCPQSSFEVLVLDEADRLLDLGFKEDLQKILIRLPKQRRTGLFSASVSEAVDQIIRVGLRNPVKIAVKVKGTAGAEDKRTPASLRLTYHLTPPTHKFPALALLLSSLSPTPQKTIVYLSTCAAVDYFQHLLPIISKNFAVVPLHGKHPPNVRQKNFTRFAHATSPSILLTTDVAARGLDIPSVDLVVQIDPPSDPKVFLHRCGRAGRAGRKGLSVLFLHPGRQEDYISFLAVRKTPIEPLQLPGLSVADGEAMKVMDVFRLEVLRDRALHDKGQRAFVSWVKSYSKHQASSIFRVGDLDWDQLGQAWGLLKLPKMPELKNWDGDRALGMGGKVDFETYEYKDKQREKHRKEELEARRNEPNQEGSLASRKKQKVEKAAWSQNRENKSERGKRREQRKMKRERTRWEKMTDEEKAKLRETERMVEEVGKQQEEQASAQDDGFEGFD